MRLTLRTLLAYRDRVLSPGDSEDLHCRIQKSEGAGNLLRRIDSVARQSDILTPAAIGTGLGADPNSVAEYLDDVLPSDQIPEFERVCLVSDVQLAELAHCHEFLVSALTTKVDVPQSAHDVAKRIGKSAERIEIQNEIRKRWLPNTTRSGVQKQVRSDAAHREIAQPGSAHSRPAEGNVPLKVQAPMVASGGDSIKPAGLDLENSTLPHEVPEYLVGANRRNWSVPLAIGALLALLGFLGWQTIGPLENVADLFNANPSATSRGDISRAAQPTGNGGEPTEEQRPSVVQPTNTSDPGLPEPTDSDVPSASSDAAAAVGAVDRDSESTAQSDGPGELPQDAAQTVDATTPPGESSHALATWRPAVDALPVPVLLKSSPVGLLRMRPGGTLNPEETALVPPVSRTHLELQPGITWKTCGPTLMQVAAPDPAQPPTVTTRLCRAVVHGAGASGVIVSTPVGDYRIELTTAATHVSIEVAYRPTAVGSVLERRAVQPTLILIVAEGSASVQASGPGAKATMLNIGEGLIVVGDTKPRVFKLQAIPLWLSDNAQRPVDQAAAEDLSQLLTADQPIPQQLLNVAGYRRAETAALAIQTLMLTGNWQPLAGGFLGNERFRAHWSATLDLARQLLAMDPGAAQRLSGALTAVYGEAQAAALLRLIVGLSEDEIAAAGLAPLVDQLDSKQLENRVLAAYELRKLTGESFGYQPFAPSSTSVQTWRRELRRLQVVQPRDPAWERSPSG